MASLLTGRLWRRVDRATARADRLEERARAAGIEAAEALNSTHGEAVRLTLRAARIHGRALRAHWRVMAAIDRAKEADTQVWLREQARRD